MNTEKEKTSSEEQKKAEKNENEKYSKFGCKIFCTYNSRIYNALSSFMDDWFII